MYCSKTFSISDMKMNRHIVSIKHEHNQKIKGDMSLKFSIVSETTLTPERVVWTCGRSSLPGRRRHCSLVLFAQCVHGGVIVWTGSQMVVAVLHLRTKKNK